MVKRYKKDLDVSYTLGTTLTIELLKTKPNYVTRVFVHSKVEKNDAFTLIDELCKQHKVELIQSDKVFNILADKENCYVIGEFKKYETPINPSTNHVVLVNPSNAGNLGTIIRTMIGFNLKDLVIITPSVDIFDPKCIRATMGALFHLNFVFYDNFKKYYQEMKTRNIYPFMLQAKKGLSEVIFTEPYSLVFGNEASGLSDEFLNYGESVIIKHTNNIDSLSLQIAVSIGIYEATKNNFK